MKQGRENEMKYLHECDCGNRSHHILHRHRGLTGTKYKGTIQCPYCICTQYIKIVKGKIKYDKNNQTWRNISRI